MTTGNEEPRNNQASWVGIGILFLMLMPYAVMAYFMFKWLSLVWYYSEGIPNASYAILVFAVGGILISIFMVMITRQIYKEFIVPKIARKDSTRQPSENKK
jgi:TRAP-type C4-dicarboxylate transport system permease small subunit